MNFLFERFLKTKQVCLVMKYGARLRKEVCGLIIEPTIIRAKIITLEVLVSSYQFLYFT